MITAATIYRVAALQRRRDIAHIRMRREALAAQARGARLEYVELEESIKQQQQALVLLGRNLDAMHGGLQELDALQELLQGDMP